MLELLLLPIDPERAHDVGVHVSWHARLMVLAWAFLFPIGILAARFFKIMPGQDWPRVLDNKTWWLTHLNLQHCGGVAMLTGLWFVLFAPERAGAGAVHILLGWTLTVLAAVQFLGGWLRGSKGGPTAPARDGSPSGDHYDMSRRRLVFEFAHKSFGYLALLLSTGAILTGLWQANAPHWMWLSVGAWWLVLAAAFFLMQRRGMAIDTYQAIWGPNSGLPGNKLKPVGVGVRRFPEKPGSKI